MSKSFLLKSLLIHKRRRTERLKERPLTAAVASKLKSNSYIYIYRFKLLVLRCSVAAKAKGHFTSAEARTICKAIHQNGAAKHDDVVPRRRSSRGFVCHMSTELKHFPTLRIEAWQGALRCTTACLCRFLATTLSEGTPESNGRVPPQPVNVSAHALMPDACQLTPMETFYNTEKLKTVETPQWGPRCSCPLYLAEVWSLCFCGVS